MGGIKELDYVTEEVQPLLVMSLCVKRPVFYEFISWKAEPSRPQCAYVRAWLRAQVQERGGEFGWQIRLMCLSRHRKYLINWKFQTQPFYLWIHQVLCHARRFVVNCEIKLKHLTNSEGFRFWNCPCLKSEEFIWQIFSSEVEQNRSNIVKNATSSGPRLDIMSVRIPSSCHTVLPDSISYIGTQKYSRYVFCSPLKHDNCLPEKWNDRLEIWPWHFLHQQWVCKCVIRVWNISDLWINTRTVKMLLKWCSVSNYHTFR